MPPSISKHRFRKLIEQAREEQLDVHKLVAMEIFDVDYDNVTPEMRRSSKSVTFLWSYSTGLL